MNKKEKKEIIFSDHAKYKINLLKELGVNTSYSFIEMIVISPDRVMEGYEGRLVAEKEYDNNRTIRVVYEEYKDYIVIVTLYPVRKGRYD